MIRFVNKSSLQLIGLLFIASSPFLFFDFFNGKPGAIFNKLACISGLSALIISIFNEAATNEKIHIQNIKYQLETKLSFVFKYIEQITFDYVHVLGIPSCARGLHAFRVAMGDLQLDGVTLIKNHASFAFWEAQLALNQIDAYLEELSLHESELSDHFSGVCCRSIEVISPTYCIQRFL